MRSNLIWKDSLRGDSSKSASNVPVIGSLVPPSTFVSSFTTSSSLFTPSITDVTFSSNSSQVLAACGKYIHVYSAYDGTLIRPLEGHTMPVTCISCSRDGRHIATGGLDKQVIIWNSSLNGILKFAHSDPIKRVTFNPATHHLASVTMRDFGFWFADCKQVEKYQSAEKINCAAWSIDGHYFALGLQDGLVSIRNRSGNELFTIKLMDQMSPNGMGGIFASNSYSSIHPRKVPSILAVAFSPRKGESDVETLAIADENQVLSFYDLNGKQIGKEKQIGFYCMSLEFSLNGEFVLLCGSNKASNLYTREGIFIGSVGENASSSWVMACALDSPATHIAMATQDGDLMVYEVLFSTVHSLYHEHYAYRNSMTDVIIHNLLTEEKVRIKCRDLVKNLAIYKDRLAIQLSDKLVIYELTSKDSHGTNGSPKSNKETKESTDPASDSSKSLNRTGGAKGPVEGSGKDNIPPTNILLTSSSDGHRNGMHSMHYKVRDRINQKFECTLMVVGANCVILCQEKKLQCINFQGTLEREWSVDSFIRYVRLTGGPPGKEGLLIGLKNGSILQIFVNNPFPIAIIQVPAAVICLDLSLDRKKLAVVDERGFCSVFDVRRKKLLYEVSSETGANSVAWNSQFEDMLAYTGPNSLCVKSLNHLVYHQSLKGFVVGFCGCKVFCLISNSVVTAEVSQTTSMNRFIEGAFFDQAYKVACLSVTQDDWNRLGHASLESLNLNIARKSFARTFNYPLLELISLFEESDEYQRITKNSTDAEALAILHGHIFACKGQLAQAVKSYKSAGRVDLAVNMFTDLKLFEQAQQLIKSYSESGDAAKQLTMKQADWVHNINEPRTAAEMYLSAGEAGKAIQLAGKHGWIDLLVSIAATCDKGDRNNLSAVADALVKHKQYFQASDVYKKIGDTKNLARVYVLSMQWQDAFALASEYPELKHEIYSPYAAWLTDQARFSEAQAAFHEAGMVKEALATLQALTRNAIVLNKYSDAGYYCWILSQQCLDLAQKAGPSSKKYSSFVAQFTQLEKQADIYYAYDRIHRFVEQPFTAYFADSLFNAARFLYHCLLCAKADPKETPAGISLVVILYALAKQSCNLGAYKLARLVYEKLQSYYVPARFASSVEFGDLTIRGKPFSDAEDLLPLCYRCSTTNPLANPKGNQCINCQQQFYFSFSNFDVLPLVPFELEEGISDEEALTLINMDAVAGAGDAADTTTGAGSNGENSTTAARRTGSFDGNESHDDDNNEETRNGFLRIGSGSTSDEMWKEERSSHHQSLAVVHSASRTVTTALPSDLEDSFEDPFTLKITTLDGDSLVYPGKVLVDRNTLAKLSKNEVLYFPNPLNPGSFSFHRKILPDTCIALCAHCHRFFLDDIETHLVLEGTCPFCRNPMKLDTSLI